MMDVLVGSIFVLLLIGIGAIIRYVAQIVRPDELVISLQGVKFSAFLGAFHVVWDELQSMEKIEKVTARGNGRRYARFIHKNREKFPDLFLGSFGFDAETIYRCLDSAKGGKLIDPGYPARPWGVVLLGFPFMLSILYWICCIVFHFHVKLL